MCYRLFFSIFKYVFNINHLVLPVIVFILSACGGGGSSSTQSTPAAELLKIEISSMQTSVVVATQISVSAIALYSDNSKRDITEEVEWLSADVLIASIDNASGNKGIVLANKVGVTNIVASYNGLEALLSLVVEDADLISISATPNSVSLPSGTNIPLKVFGNYSNNTIQDVTQQTQWLSSNPAVASIDVSNNVVAHAVGVADVRATVSGLTLNIHINVTAAVLEQIIIEPELILPAGTELKVTAKGQYSGGAIIDISSQVDWSLSKSPIADLVPHLVDGDLHLVANIPGSSSLSVQLGGVSATSIVTVSDAVLTQLYFGSSQVTLVKALRKKLSLFALYSDNSYQDVTAFATWSSSNEVSVGVENGVGLEGLISAYAAGESMITANYEGDSVALDVNVIDAQLLEIEVAPLNPTYAAGIQTSLTAMGEYSDGSVIDITSQVSWFSSNPAVAVVLNGHSYSGHLVTLSAGGSTVVASFDKVVGKINVSVSSALLQTLSIDAHATSLPIGAKQSLHATAHYDDGSTHDVTDLVIWESADNTTVLVKNSGAEHGLVTALAVANAIEIKAGLPGSNIAAAVTNISVSNATLQGIEISSPVSSTVNHGHSNSLVATANFSDLSSLDITDQVMWLSSDINIAAVSNERGRIGQVTGTATINNQNADITAIVTINNIVEQASHNIVVNYVAQDAVSISLSASPNIILNDDIDTADLNIVVLAADQNIAVADGTLVDVQLISGDGVLSSMTASTIDGKAQVQLTSSIAGYSLIRATINNTNLSNTTNVLASASFGQAFTGVAYARFSVDNANQVVVGSQFYFVLFNVSNRLFGLAQYRFSNETEQRVIESTTDAALLNNNIAAGGDIFKVLVVLDLAENSGVFSSIFDLQEATTNSAFSISAFYNTQQ